MKRVATVIAFLTVGFSHARSLSGNRMRSIWMGHATENKSSVISFQLSVTTTVKAVADNGQLIPNPQPRGPIPQPFPLRSFLRKRARPNMTMLTCQRVIYKLQ
jgi:hypothetical protein